MKNVINNRWTGLLAGSALVAGLAFSFGFQQGSEKIATVDVQKVVLESKLGKSTRDQVNSQLQAMSGLLDYFKVNDVLSKDQAVLIKSLTLKENPTDSDKQTLEATKAQGAAAMTEFNSLMEKKSPTEAERNKLQAYSEKRNTMHEYADQVGQELQQSFANIKNKKTSDLLDTARAAIKEAAQKKGFTMVLDSNAVIYSANDKANDITEDAKATMDAKK